MRTSRLLPIGLTAAVLLLTSGCGASDVPSEELPEPATAPTAETPPATEPTTASGTPSAPAPATAPQAPPAPASPSPTAEPVPTASGWGPLTIGMTRAEVVAAAGEDANSQAVGGPEPEVCDEFRPERAAPGMIVMIENGRLSRITLVDGSEVATEHGLEVGAPAAEVKSTLGSTAEVTSHKYLDAPGEYITIWETPPSNPNPRGFVYETGLDGRVNFIHAGGPSIQYVEGCL